MQFKKKMTWIITKLVSCFQLYVYPPHFREVSIYSNIKNQQKEILVTFTSHPIHVEIIHGHKHFSKVSKLSLPRKFQNVS